MREQAVVAAGEVKPGELLDPFEAPVERRAVHAQRRAPPRRRRRRRRAALRALRAADLRGGASSARGSGPARTAGRRRPTGRRRVPSCRARRRPRPGRVRVAPSRTAPRARPGGRPRRALGEVGERRADAAGRARGSRARRAGRPGRARRSRAAFVLESTRSPRRRGGGAGARRPRRRPRRPRPRTCRSAGQRSAAASLPRRVFAGEHGAQQRLGAARFSIGLAQRRHRLSATSPAAAGQRGALVVGQRAGRRRSPTGSRAGRRRGGAAGSPRRVIPRASFAGTSTRSRARCRPSPSSHAVTSGGVSRVRIDRWRTGSVSSGCALCASSRQRRSSTEIGRPDLGLEVIDDLLQVGHAPNLKGDSPLRATIVARRGLSPLGCGDGCRGGRGRDLWAGDGVSSWSGAGTAWSCWRRRASAPGSRRGWRGSSGSRIGTRGCVRWRWRRGSGGASGSGSSGRTLLGDEGLVVVGGEEQAEAMREVGAPVEPLTRSRDRGAAAAAARSHPWSHGIWDPLAGATRVKRTLEALAARVTVQRTRVESLDEHRGGRDRGLRRARHAATDRAARAGPGTDGRAARARDLRGDAARRA